MLPPRECPAWPLLSEVTRELLRENEPPRVRGWLSDPGRVALPVLRLGAEFERSLERVPVACPCREWLSRPVWVLPSSLSCGLSVRPVV